MTKHNAMVYASDSNKWRAYQFLDPFAAGSFLVCNKIKKIFCRPDCDAHPTTELRSLIKFVDTTQEAVSLGYVPCESCDPMSVPKIDVNLLLRTVKDCNNRIGFVPPLMDDDESKITETKENIIRQGIQRRQLVPAISYNNQKYSADKSSASSVSKNDLEHYNLIDLACRHLALAAANSIFSPLTPGSLSPTSDDNVFSKKKNGTKKRRGGVLGFKELAAKLKLSAWHFHRVFKSITGLTPKNYGDMCWEYLVKQKAERGSESVLTPPGSLRECDYNSQDSVLPFQPGSATSLLQDQNYPLGNNCFNSATNTYSYYSPTQSNSSPEFLPKTRKRECPDDFDDLEGSHKRPFTQANFTTCLQGANVGGAHNADLYANQVEYEGDFGSYMDLSMRATSAPDLSIYGNMLSLFDHSKPVDFGPMPLEPPLGDLDVNGISSLLAPLGTNPLMVNDPYVPTAEIVNEQLFTETEAFSADLFP